MPKFRPRLSLLTALLMTAIVAMAIVVVLLWREVGPLRAEVRQMRTELGKLTIDDADRAQAICVRQPDPNLWRWRIYIPPGKRYKVCEFGGQLPPRGKLTNREWLTAMRNAQYGILSGEFSSDSLADEFTMEAALVRVDGGWRFATHPGGGASTYPFTDSWPASSRTQRSDVWQDTQRIFRPGEPILLLYLSKPVKTPTTGGGFQINEPTAPEEGIALWLLPVP